MELIVRPVMLVIMLLTEEGDLIVNEEQELDTGVKDRLLLERGGVVLAEADRFAFPIGFVVDENENLSLRRSS